jgi:hypothetical protein
MGCSGPDEATFAVAQHHSKGNTVTYKESRKATRGGERGRTGALPQPGRNSAALFKIRPDPSTRHSELDSSTEQ